MAEEVLPEARIPTYVEGLDERLGGGIPKGHVVLVSGPPGSLKSSFVYRILFREALKGSSALYLSMEQSRASLVSQMASLGMDPGKAKGVHVIDVRALRKELEEMREQPPGFSASAASSRDTRRSSAATSSRLTASTPCTP